MDRRRATGLVSALAALACASAAFVAAQAPPPLLAAQWLPEDRRLSALSTAPGECLAPAADEATARRIAIGRAAFRTPLLLGGQAARSGLSCDACHRNGRSNPDFFVSHLSDAPGTADVTTALMSAHRGDGTFNPRAIPDLAGDLHAVPRDERSRALETFVRGLIVEEFDGAEPTKATLDGLATYIRHLRPSACADAGPIRLATDLENVRAALAAAQYALDDGDAATARLMVASARGGLRAIDERFPGAAFQRRRDALRAASLELASLQDAIGREAPDLGLRIAAWLADMRGWAAPLLREESKSLYARERLAEALMQATPGKAEGH